MNVIELLQDKDEKKAYEIFKQVSADSARSNKYYDMYNEFLILTKHKNSFVRTRGFSLCCCQSRWDGEDKIKKSLKELMQVLYDEKPITVRKALESLHEVVIFKPELADTIKKYVNKIDLSRYKDSMSPLIRKDMDELLKIID